MASPQRSVDVAAAAADALEEDKVPQELLFQASDLDQVEEAMVFTTHHGSCVDVDPFVVTSTNSIAYRLVLRLRVPKPEVAAQYTTFGSSGEVLALRRLPPDYDNYMMYAEVYYWNCDSLPEELTEAEKSLFVRTKKQVLPNEEEADVLFYSNERELRDRFGFRADLDERLQTRIRNCRRGEILKLHQPLAIRSEKLSPASPRIIDTKAAARLLRECLRETPHAALFYVGSGVSAAAGFMYGKQGEAAVGQKRGVAVDNYVRSILNSDKMESLTRHSNDSLWFAWTNRSILPTEAHHAIASLAKRTNCAVFTTNSDQLLQLAGVRPQKSAESLLSALARSPPIVKLRFIFCFTVGESYWLLRLRETNPEGCTVVAFDLRPEGLTYLRDSDYAVVGDIQQTLPSFCDELLCSL